MLWSLVVLVLLFALSLSSSKVHASLIDFAFDKALSRSSWHREATKAFVSLHPSGILPVETYLTMRDGVQLFTVYWAIDSTPRPTVLFRSPYGPIATENMALAYLPYGFNVVMQNLRATGLSEGNWTFFDGCWNDANDTMTWTAQQPWSNGEIFGAGASADGFATYFDLKIPQPYMKGQYLIFSSGYPYLTCFENYGSFHENLAEDWLDIMHVWRPFAPNYLDVVLDHEGTPSFDDWWAPRTMNASDYARINFPAIHLGGWYDIFTKPMITTFDDYQTKSGPLARGKQKFVMGPRGHCMIILGSWKYYFPDDEYDLLWSFEASVDLFRNLSTFKWPDADLQLQSELAVAPNLKTYTFYIMGPSKLSSSGGSAATVGMYWTTLSSWPTPKNVTLFLTDSNGLSPSKPLASYVKSYNYDPNNPVPTLGGNNLFTSCGPEDQRSVETRADVLVFTSDVLASPLTIVGSMEVFLFVSSNCTDTDFTVKVSDVYPDGASVILTDTMLRMRWRDSKYNITLMQPGVIYPINISLWQTAQIFDVGHQIRVAISSSNFPRFSANPNNGLLVREGGAKVVANNALYLGPKHPSRVILPTVQPSQIPPNVGLHHDQ